MKKSNSVSKKMILEKDFNLENKFILSKTFCEKTLEQMNRFR